jgi:hypothetical protein
VHSKQHAASSEKIDKAVEPIRKDLEGFEEIHTAANTAKSSVEKILKSRAAGSRGSVVANTVDRR